MPFDLTKLNPVQIARFRWKCPPGPVDECWLWQGSRTTAGYGVMGVSKREKVYAHRVALFLATGEILTGKDSLHSCDNPPCCNPHHLNSGTRRDNVQDGIEKGRMLRGEANGNAILTADDVLTIRRLVADGPRGTAERLGEHYGVCQQTISNIVRRKSWFHIP